MQAPNDGFATARDRRAAWTRWLARVALGAGSLVAAAWLLAPWLRELLLSAPVVAFDLRLAAGLQARMTDAAFAQAMRWLSLLHGTAGILALAALAAVALWRAGERAFAVVLAVTVPGGLLLNVAVKHAVQRARPDAGGALEALATYSFPSGHTAGAAVLYGVAVAWLWPRLAGAGARAVVLSAALGVVLLVAASRVARGVHFPSDCIASLLEASFWLAVCLAGVVRPQRGPALPTPHLP